MERTLKELKKYINLKIIATGMHLSEKYGYTVKEIEKEGFDVEKVESLIDSNSLGAMVKTLGIELYGITQIVERLNPKLIFVEGDRGDALAGAIIGSHLNIPVVHHGGGDISESIDNKIRYATSMFSDYHLVGNIESYNRLIKIGIPKENVFIVGEPGLDDIYLKNFTSKDKIIGKFNINKTEPLVLLLYHPNTKELREIKSQIKSILDAIVELELQTIAIYSNSDAGGYIINNYLEEYSSKYDFICVFPHIYRKDFLGLMNICDLMIGNSSSGIIELPSFKKPFIHVGNRQRGRLTAGNVVFVEYDKEKIKESINKALHDNKFKEKLRNIKNPYGNGTTFLKITKIILDILNGEYNGNYQIQKRME
jgi:UDP-hydrolysing UDP-N-acetyl-D-glucosamine 2-epimerase